jgi:hypothetical protein
MAVEASAHRGRRHCKGSSALEVKHFPRARSDAENPPGDAPAAG